MYRPLLLVVIDCGGGVDGGGNEYPKSEGREAFVRSEGRRNYRCFFGKRGGWCRGSVMVRDSSSVGSNAVLLLIMPD